MIVAEIGINHNGDINLAKECVLAAKNAGADAVKFQNYRTEDFISDETLIHTYVSQGFKISEAQFTMFKRYEFGDEHILELADFCKREQILFGCTPSNEQGIALLKRAGAAFVKNSSDYLTHLPLISAMAKSGMPTILSTGMASLSEIDDAVTAFRNAGGKDLTLLHCTSVYPTEARDVHLRKIPVLRDAFACPAGFSDHTQGVSAAIASVVLGARVIEKHFTLDKSLPGPDHVFSANPAELQALIANVRAVEKQLGAPSLEPAEGERRNRTQYTLSCVASRNLPAGHIITLADIAFRRPGSGLRPKHASWLIGRQLRQAVQNGTTFHLEKDFI